MDILLWSWSVSHHWCFDKNKTNKTKKWNFGVLSFVFIQNFPFTEGKSERSSHPRHDHIPASGTCIPSILVDYPCRISLIGCFYKSVSLISLFLQVLSFLTCPKGSLFLSSFLTAPTPMIHTRGCQRQVNSVHPFKGVFRIYLCTVENERWKGRTPGGGP